MPNWCEGNIRVRGTYDKIVKFFSENLIALKQSKNPKLLYDELPAKIHKDSEFYTEIRKPDNGPFQKEFWFKDTNRQFMNADFVGLSDWSEDPLQEIVICVDGYKGAWGIDLEGFKAMAVKYGVDIRIVGYERGMEFMETAELYRNGKINEKTSRFNDWMWDCPCPNLGG